MDESQRLLNIVIKISNMLNIDISKVKERKDWKKEKQAFIDSIVNVMEQLKYFGFKKSEIELFKESANATLEYVLFFFIMVKAKENSTKKTEFFKYIVNEWYSNHLFDNLNEISEVILDAFFERKGGICFTKTAKVKKSV